MIDGKDIGYPETKTGSKGIYVLILQDALNALGYDTGSLDGIFGSKTKAAVLDFQNKNELIVDGIVGNKTWDKLMDMVVRKRQGRKNRDKLNNI